VQWPKWAKPTWARCPHRRFRRLRRDFPRHRRPAAHLRNLESRIKQVRDELNEGDQILVKVLALEGNKIKLSRRAILKEEREKLKKTEAGTTA